MDYKQILAIGLSVFLFIGVLCYSEIKITEIESTYKLDLGIARQQQVYSFDTQVYIKDKIIDSCADNDKVICKYSCAPDGLCVFIPKDVAQNIIN